MSCALILPIFLLNNISEDDRIYLTKQRIYVSTANASQWCFFSFSYSPFGTAESKNACENPVCANNVFITTFTLK